MTSKLQQMRRGAGFRSAKELADELGIPESTYCRYEREPLSIPTAKALAIAERLGCTVDEVLGIEPPAPAAIDGLRERFERLPRIEQGMLLDYLDYLERRARQGRKDRHGSAL